MLGVDRRAVQNFDWVLSALTLTLLVIGIGNLISATHGGDGVLLSPEVRRQLTSLGVGALALLVSVSIDYRHLERLAIPIYLATVALVASTLVFAPVSSVPQTGAGLLRCKTIWSPSASAGSTAAAWPHHTAVIKSRMYKYEGLLHIRFISLPDCD